MASQHQFTLESFILWALKVIRALMRKRYHFVALTPPFFKNQLVLDKKRRAVFSVAVRGADDYFTFEQIYLYENYNLEKLLRYTDLKNHYQTLVAAGRAPLIIDCGANIGLSSKYFSQFFPEASVVAIEPDAGNVAQARLNCRTADKVRLLQAAVASAPGKGKLVDPGLGPNAFRVTKDGGGDLEFTSIDALLDDPSLKETAPFIVKIDIEGFEDDLFSANTGWIDKFPLLIVELHDWMLPRQGNAHNFLREMAARDRDFVYIGENVFSIANAISAD